MFSCTKIHKMEKILLASSKLWSGFRNTVEKHTQLNMHVGAGAVTPKRVFRYPSPASQEMEASEHQKALHLAVKAEDLGFVKRVDR